MDDISALIAPLARESGLPDSEVQLRIAELFATPQASAFEGDPIP